MYFTLPGREGRLNVQRNDALAGQSKPRQCVQCCSPRIRLGHSRNLSWPGSSGGWRRLVESITCKCDWSICTRELVPHLRNDRELHIFVLISIPNHTQVHRTSQHRAEESLPQAHCEPSTSESCSTLGSRSSKGSKRRPARRSRHSAAKRHQ